jgi:tetratricopeptide (TPR) repeat protein/predicted Ser/Thr protein kinase
MDDLSGQEIRGYKLIERIGEGGFGFVYRAKQPSVNREVAIKVILPEYAKHPEFVRRFEAEAQTVAKLEHPHIVPLHDYWRDEEGAYLVMRWLRGGSLRESLDGGPWEVEAAGRLLDQIADALNVAHEQGVVHRDMKPENILLDEAGNAYLSDFGIAKDLASDGLTQPGKIVGSVDYLAPEQAKGEEVTPRTDIYGLGVVLYEMLTGEHPFPGLTPVQLLQKHLNQPLPLMKTSHMELDEALNYVVQRATAKDPDERYSGATEMVEDYHQALTSDEVPIHLPYEVGIPAFLKVVEEELEIHRPIFVGRDRELAQLNGYLDKALEGHGQVVFVTGGAGRGKTALIDEFNRRAQDTHDDLIVAIGNCNAQTGIGDPYLPFRDIFSMLTGDVEGRWVSGSLTRENALRLWDVLPLTLDAILARGPFLLDVFVSGEILHSHGKVILPPGAEPLKRLGDLLARTKTGVSELEQSLLFEQCANVLNILSSQRPLLLFMDDLQWADDASLSLLFQLGQRIEGNPILILGAYRADEVALGRGEDRHPLEGVVNELKRKYGDILIDLAAEDENEGRMFVEGFLDTQPNQLGLDFRSALFKRTGGQPLFTIELLLAMQDRGDLIHDEKGRWVEGPGLSWDKLPARVEAVIEERIKRLDEDLREILSVASVEGEEFTVQVIARVQNMEERFLLQRLWQDLEKRHRLVRERDDLRVDGKVLTRYRFSHQLFQRYLYCDLSAGERRLLHGEIAAVLEDLHEGETRGIAVQLAHHYMEAKDTPNAVKYLLEAAELARERGANAEALKSIEQILAHGLDVDLVTRLHAMEVKSDVLHNLGDYDACLSNEEILLTLAQESQDESRLAEAHYVHGVTLHDLGNLQGALEVLDQAVNAARRAGDQQIEAKVQGYKVVPLTRLGEIDAAEKLAEEAISLAETSDDDLILARNLTNVSFFYGETGDLSRAVEMLLRQLEITTRIGSLKGRAIGLGNLGYNYVMLGMYPEGISNIEQAMEISLQIGYIAQCIHNRWNLSLANLRMGDSKAAVRDLAPVEQEVIGKGFLEIYHLYYRGLAGEGVGEYTKAKADFERGYEGFLEMDFKANAFDSLAGSTRCSMKLGQLDEATQSVEKLWGYLKEHGSGSMELPVLSYLTCVDAFREIGDTENCATVAHAGYEVLMEMADKISDQDMRRSFLDNVPEHRTMVEMWDRMGG